MSSYNDLTHPVLYGRYGNGRTNKTNYGVGMHPHHVHHPLHTKCGGNSAREFWDYPNRLSHNPVLPQYGGGYPDRYKLATDYEKGNNYPVGYTSSINTFIGGKRVDTLTKSLTKKRRNRRKTF